MGFGFNLSFILVLFPLTCILLIVWGFSRKKIIGKTLGFIWIGICGLMLLSVVFRWWTSKTILKKTDYYGEYVVNRDYFPGTQSNWQYNHYRFEITNTDSIFFHLTDGINILKTYRGTVTTVKPHSSERLVIHMEPPTYHIVLENPTTYRSAWDFTLVFYSPEFNNVYFKKGKWKPIERK